MRKQVKYRYLMGKRIILSSDIDCGKVLDTEVFLDDHFLIAICGERIDEFMSALKNLFDEFAI